MKTKPAPQAQDFMTRHVQTVTPGMTLAEVITFLKHHKVSNAPVVETDAAGRQKLVGFISEGDCLEHLSNEIFFGSPAPQQTVRTMMKRHPVCVEPTMDVFTLASVFVNHRHRHLPVVADDSLVGIVSRCDILAALDDFYQQTLQQRDEEQHPPDLHEVMNLRFVSRGR